MDTNIGHDIGQEKDLLKDTRAKNSNAFESKESFNIAVLKAERLASALYLVSNLISDEEPLKWTVRKAGTDVITDIVKVGAGRGDKGQRISLEKISAKIFEISSLLQVAWMGGLISKMNFEILKSEYFRLGEFLKNKFYFSNSETFLISPNFFSSIEVTRLREKEALFLDESKKNEENFLREIERVGPSESTSVAKQNQNNILVKDILNKGQQKYDSDNVLDNKKTILRTITSFGLIGSKERKTNSTAMSDSGKKKRHELILSLLSSGASHTVPEILKLIGLGSDLSEKTIQRDLLFMVSSGLLKKTGERRWSRYSLVAKG